MKKCIVYNIFVNFLGERGGKRQKAIGKPHFIPKINPID